MILTPTYIPQRRSVTVAVLFQSPRNSPTFGDVVVSRVIWFRLWRGLKGSVDGTDNSVYRKSTRRCYFDRNWINSSANRPAEHTVLWKHELNMAAWSRTKDSLAVNTKAFWRGYLNSGLRRIPSKYFVPCNRHCLVLWVPLGGSAVSRADALIV